MNKHSSLLLALLFSLFSLSACYQHVAIAVKPAETATILTEYQEKALLLIFYRTTCPWCLKELSELPALKEQFTGNNRVEFIGFSLDRSMDDLDYFVAKNTLPFAPYWLDFTTADELLDGFNELGITLPTRFGVPLLIILDTEHRQQATLLGYHTKEAISDALSDILP